jgi:hypothetical protein
MDLDLVVTGPLDALFDRPEPFVILQGVNAVNPCPFNGSLWMLEAGYRPDVWHEFSPELAAKVPFHEFPDDQAWLADMIPDAAGWGPSRWRLRLPEARLAERRGAAQGCPDRGVPRLARPVAIHAARLGAGALARADFAALDRLPDDIIPVVGCTPELKPLIDGWRARAAIWIYWDRGYARRVFATDLPPGKDGGFYRWHVEFIPDAAVRAVAG